MLLNHQNESCFAVDVHQAARVEEDLEVDRLPLAARDDSVALRILAVALDVDDPVETVQLDQHLNAIRQAHDVESAGRNVGRGLRPRPRRNVLVAAVGLVGRISDEVRWADADGDVARDGARCARSARVARGYALVRPEVAFLVRRTVVVRPAHLFDALTSAYERIAHGAGRADAIVAALQIDAVGVRGARVAYRDALVDVPAGTVWLQFKSTGTDAEALLRTHVDAVLVLRARVCRGAVTAGQDTEFSHTIVVGRTAAGVVGQADEISGAVVVYAADLHSDASHEGVPGVARRADAHGLVLLHAADGREAARVVEARIVTVSPGQIASFVKGALVVRGAAGDLSRRAVSLVRVAHGTLRALALKRSRQVHALRSLCARLQFGTLVDVRASAVGSQAIAPRADAEAALPSRVDALLVWPARVCGGTVPAHGNAVVVSPLEHRRTAAVAVL